MKMEKRRRLERVGATVLALVAGNALVFGGETITGTKNITADTTGDFYQVGTADQAGMVNITGGTLTLEGGTPSDFRGQTPSLLILNGTVNVSNASLVAKKGIYANAQPGNSANLVLNNGAYVETNGYPAFGSDIGNSGSLTVNSGATFKSTKSFYCSGHGIGTVLLNGGTMDLVGSGLQIARDYDGKGGSEGTFTMTGGVLNVGSYLIMGLKNKANPDHVNVSEFTMTGGTTKIGSYFCIANNNDAKRDPSMIKSIVNIGGGAETAKLTTAGNFNIGNGEGETQIVNRPADGTMNVYDGADIKLGVDLATENTAQDTFFGIGSAAKLNVYGGSMSAYGKKGAVNVGSILVDGGTLNFASSVGTLKNQGNVAVTGGTLIVGGNMENTGAVTISDGQLKVTGTYAGADKTTVGLDHGLGILSKSDIDKKQTLITAQSGLTGIKGSDLFTLETTDTTVNATLKSAANKGELTLNSELALADTATSGYVTLSGFDGDLNAQISMLLNGLNADSMATFTDWLDDSALFSGADFVGDADSNTVTVSNFGGLDSDSLFAWDFSGYNTLNNMSVSLSALGMNNSSVPEPATWAMLIFGVLGIFGVRNVRNIRNRKMSA
ncbi:MAG: PEP-CTERM sorting domain-containing protein [Planctomycetia bacterium]|nr:PEP-CTERM sorting domain-containing protein [Planctomycetia bacterium]